MSEDNGKKWDDSLISMGLGALVVVVSGILLFNYFNNQTPKLIKDQGQKSVAVSSSMPKSEGLTPSATSSSVLAAKVTRPSPVVTMAAKVTTSPQTAVNTKPTISPATSPKASVAPQVMQASAPVTESKTLPTTYTVQAGDSLWVVSEKFYGTGYQWKNIATANKIARANTLEKGQVLTVPKVEMISAASTDKSQVAQAPTSTPKASMSPAPAIGGASVVAPLQPAETTPQGAITYTVVHGDTLWSIAQAKCTNSYAWSSIARQNKLIHPGIIHPGNTFTFTCQ